MQPLDNSLFSRLAKAIRAQIAAVQGIYVFGSEASGHLHTRSDLDLAVLAPGLLNTETLFVLGGELATIARRQVDLVDLRAASTVIRSQVIAHGRRIYSGDEIACEQFEDLVYSSYARLNEERRQILDDIRTRGRIHG